MQYVFIVDENRQPLTPCHPAVARKLLSQGKAAVLRRYPFTLILRVANLLQGESCFKQDLRVKIDPGSKVTGLALVQESTGKILWAAEISHRGQIIKKKLADRRSLRRGRRNRKTRYRKPRFLNRTRPEGWLPPSLESRVSNIMTWVSRLSRVSPITAISMELVRFDTQKMENSEISGVEYQQGSLLGYEVREYLLEKWGRKCAYCGKENVPMEIEHIIPRSRDGSNRVSNLTLACEPCNKRKGNKTAAEFGHPEIQAKARAPLKDAAAINATRWRLFNELKGFGLEVECGSGGRTKFNRRQREIPKAHWLDAACVGASTPERLILNGITPLTIKATGWGKRQRVKTDKYGFPEYHASRMKKKGGFQSGDIVKDAKHGCVGRAVPFLAKNGKAKVDVYTKAKKWGGVDPKYLTAIHRQDGYAY